jgi:hypothetical protein
MPVHRFLRVPGASFSHVPVKGFPTWQACAAEVKRVTALW